MICLLTICFYILIFLFHTHEYCLNFIHHDSHNSSNECKMHEYKQDGFSYCLSCDIRQIMMPQDNIALNKSCLPAPGEPRCMVMAFNTSFEYENFTVQYSDLISHMFYTSEGYSFNDRHFVDFQIQYYHSNNFSLDFMRTLDQTTNRSYNGIRFTILKWKNDEDLYIDNNVQNTTFYSLAIIITCSKGRYIQYTYRPRSENSTFRNSVACQYPFTTTFSSSTIQNNPRTIPTTPSASTIQKNLKTIQTTVLNTTKKFQLTFSFLITLIATGILIPCLLFLLCLYILCKRKNNNNSGRGSLTSYLSTPTPSPSLSNEDSRSFHSNFSNKKRSNIYFHS